MKKYILIPAMFLFLNCSLIAKPVENGDLIPSIWHGYYNSTETPSFEKISFYQFKIDENFINIKSGNYSSTTGKPQQNTAGSYKITKTLKNSPEEYQVLIIDALADNPVERIFGLKKNAHAKICVLEPVLWKGELKKSNYDYQKYLHTENYEELVAVNPDILTPDTEILFDTFLERFTGGKDSDTWVLTEVAANVSLGLLSMVGMSVGTEIVFFKECEKNPNGTPKLDQGNTIWGYAHGTKKSYPLYYTPIPIADKENKYGIYWFQGNWIFKNRRIEIPVMIHESKGINRAYSGVVNGIGSTKPWDPEKDWLYLEKYSLDTILKNNNIIARKTAIVTD